LENLPAASGLLELLVGSRNLTSLSGISSFPTVKKVRILDAISLIDLSSLFLLSNLETLYLHNVKKLKKFECLRGNKSLRELKFINCKEIDSISFLGDLENLEHIEIGGNTVVRDGDLSVLLRLPKLRSAIITPKAHYEPRAKEVFNRLRSQGK
jgi:Leucine-rich repeat (LRR) protein